MSEGFDAALTSLLLFLRDERQFDFTGYKHASLARRIAKRMQIVGAENYSAYHQYLEANPGEFPELFNTILINVTELLRDREAWVYLEQEVIPRMVESRPPGEPLRVWSAGCATGEEAYSLAVLLAEAVGEERFRQDVKVYATDADNEALAVARHGCYPEAALVKAFGADRAARFFEMDSGMGLFRSDLRHSLIFGRHDLIQDPPISRVQLLACRNTLMYFTSEAQSRILTGFHFALSPDGYLFLGKSEALATRTGLFEALTPRQHIFVKRDDAGRPGLAAGPVARTYRRAKDVIGGIGGVGLEWSSVPQVMIDRSSTMSAANRSARTLLGIGRSDIGRPLADLEFARRATGLLQAVDEALRENRTISIADLVWDTPSGEPAYLDVAIALVGDGATSDGAILSFADVGRFRAVREELEHYQLDLEAAYEELQSAIEELETTNEELQSAVEELETTNEELHSTNEELETMNEELQSTNEELETINTELRVRTSQLDEANQFLQSVLAGLHSAVVVLSPDLHVREWSRQAEEYWGLRADEVSGQHFLNLDIGLPVDQLRPAIRAVITGQADHREETLSAVNRRGRPVTCTVAVSPLLSTGTASGAILIMDVEPAMPSEGSAKPPGDTAV